MTLINILLVDDDVKNLAALESILNAPEYRLLKACTADETLRILMDQDCAAIVMDVKMPDMSGIELAQLIKQRRKTQHIPILFLTAHYYEERDVVLGYDVGAVDYLTKPVLPSVLRSKIAVFVELFRKTAELARVNAAMEAEIVDRQKAEERFRLLFEASPHAKIGVNDAGCVALLNTRMESLFGYSRDELLGQNLEKVLPSGLPPGWIEQDAAVERHPSWELTGVKKDGTRVPVEAVFSSFESSDGHLRLVSLADISRRKLAEEARIEAETANRAKDRFLAMLSHELRTPLSPVLHAVALIEEENNPAPPVRDLLQTIRRNVQLEARLIDDLLDVARIRSGKLQINPEDVDAHDLLHRALEICQPDIEEKGLHVKMDLAAKLCRLRADPARLQQIFWNLISNAIKYTGPGDALLLSTSDDTENGMLRVEVRDTGIGIDPERLEGIFDAFEQAHGGRSFGLGLGLAISRILTEMHGGTVEAHSDGPGRGSVFTVRLPAEGETSPQGLSSAPSAGSSLKSLRVLLVEDHADTAAKLKRLLTNRGCLVTTAGSVAEAKVVMKQARADVLLSDIGLPDGQGLELMQPFFAISNGRPVAGIALSGYGMPEDVERSTAAGFAHHLTKPIDISRLEKILAGVAGNLAAK
jgi:PAS domain S-box-containing protein